MINLKTERRQKLGKLFTGTRIDGCMLNAILDGHIGEAFTDAENPTYGILELTEAKVAFIGGDFTHPSVCQYLKQLSRFWMLFVTSDDFEETAQRVHPHKWITLDRYPFSTENLSMAKMQQLKTQLPPGFQVKEIDVALANRLAEDKENEFASYHLMNFESPADFVERGVGYCVCEGETIACVASSFAVCRKGIEIQIDTRKDYRGRGLATIAAAYLIAYCLENELDPGWDAATDISANLAKKLGYTPQPAYPMYLFTKSRALVMLRYVAQKIKKFLGK